MKVICHIYYNKILFINKRMDKVSLFSLKKSNFKSYDKSKNNKKAKKDEKHVQLQYLDELYTNDFLEKYFA